MFAADRVSTSDKLTPEWVKPKHSLLVNQSGMNDYAN